MKHLLYSAFATFIFFPAQAQPTNGLVAYWPMNGSFTDAGPFNIPVTNYGATTTTNYVGAPNSAMNFSNPGAYNVVTQYATHPVNSNLSFGTAQDFTIDFSFYANSPFIHTGGFYDNNLNYSGLGVWFWTANGYPQIQFNFKNGSVGTTNGAFQLGVWKHVCCVRSGASLQIYINGVLNVTGSPGSSTPVYSYPARFGTMFFSGYSPAEYNGFNGKLDEFRIYNRALTAAEILALSSITLPVKLTSFTAVNNNNTIGLNWKTAFEQNSSHFIIQRSVDAVNFTDVARVTAAGNSNSPLAYSYNDILTASIQIHKTIFYRLQSFDTDGKYTNSHVVAMNLDKTDIQLSVFPNPAKDILQVQTGVGLKGNTSLIISDAAGRQVYKKEVVLLQGSNTLPVNISMLSAGIYTVRLINGNDNYIKQFVKE